MDERERDALTILHDTLMISEARVYEHVTTTFRWLMATLFTANGGAIVALINHIGDVQGSRDALACFAIGLILSLLMAVLSTFLGFRSAVAILADRMRIEHALMTDEAPKAEIEEFTARQKPTWKTWVPSCVGIASLLCFVGGAGMIAAAYIR